MPRTILGQKRNKFEKTTVLIWGILGARGMTVAELSEGSGVPPATLYRRKKKPQDFTLDELSRVGRFLGVPIEELRQNTILY